MQMDLHVFYLESIVVWILSSYCIFIVFSIVSTLSSIPCALYLHSSETALQFEGLGR